MKQKINKIVFIICLCMVFLVIGGCSNYNGGFPRSCEPQEEFCNSKGMNYQCGNHKYNTFWCIDKCNNKVAFTLEEFNKFYYKYKLEQIDCDGFKK